MKNLFLVGLLSLAVVTAWGQNIKRLILPEPSVRPSKAQKEQINRKYGTTMLIVTHNNSIKNMVHKVLIIKDGLIHKSYENEVRVPARELEDL